MQLSGIQPLMFPFSGMQLPRRSRPLRPKPPLISEHRLQMVKIKVCYGNISATTTGDIQQGRRCGGLVFHGKNALDYVDTEDNLTVRFVLVGECLIVK